MAPKQEEDVLSALIQAWSRHGSSPTAHGHSTWTMVIKSDSLGLVFVRLIFHPSSSATLGMCLCIPSQLSAGSSSREGSLRAAAQPSL